MISIFIDGLLRTLKLVVSLFALLFIVSTIEFIDNGLHQWEEPFPVALKRIEIRIVTRAKAAKIEN